MLLQIVERTVIYGHPPSLVLEQLPQYFSGSYNESGLRQFADMILEEKQAGSTVVLQGKLLFKPTERTYAMQRKLWAERWFVIENRVMYCYRKSDNKILLRAMHLQDCFVADTVKSRHEHYFELHSCTGVIFKLRASTAEGKIEWVVALQRQGKVCIQCVIYNLISLYVLMY